MSFQWLTTERIVALIVVALQVLFAVLFSTVSPDWGVIAVWTVVLSLPGLVLIWDREALSMFAFMRGIFRQSPPRLVDVFGWLFLIGLPVIYLYGLLP